MTWTKFLAALAEGGWSTEIDTAAVETLPVALQSGEITCRSTQGDIVVETRWSGAGRKFDGATINGLEAGKPELAAVLS